MIKYAQQYLRSAETICKLYQGDIPLAAFLKQYFQQQKKFGSKDRRYITHLCYNYYRIGHALKELVMEERILVAFYLSNRLAGEWQLLFEQQWLNNWTEDVYQRISFIQSIYPAFALPGIFPWINRLSDGIAFEELIVSHLIQPDLFLRIRPGKIKTVVQKLSEQGVPFHQLSESCLALPNTSKIDTVLEIDQEAVIQDYSSQRITEFLQLLTPGSRQQTTLWDCCAASGGKSILAVDVLGKIGLTVSDIRASILQNLKQRFANAGIKKYQSFVADISANFQSQNSSIPQFNIILCDAPCSGSGTWSRTPEQLVFFTEEKIEEYALLQKKILANIIPYVAKDGYLLYITCSVFRKENEEQVSFIQQQGNFELVKMEVLKGYDRKADSMFGALLKKG